MQKKKQIAVLGYGVVGSGVVELFYQNQEKIEKNTGYPMDIKYILDLRTFEGDPYADKVVHDINVILQDPEVGYVAECMGGVNPAFEFVSSCLKAGKSVSTSNSSWLQKKGTSCCKLQRETTATSSLKQALAVQSRLCVRCIPALLQMICMQLLVF